MPRLLSLVMTCCLFAPLTFAACTADTTDTEYRAQLEAAELSLEDAADLAELVSPGVVLEAAFEAGVDNGYYDVVVSVDEGVRTISLDAITAEQVDETFTRDDSRRAEADAIAGGRRSLGRVVRDLRAERPNERGTRVRSDGDDAAVHTLDRNGNAREHRRGLADEPTPR